MTFKKGSDKLICVIATNSLWNAFNFRLNLLRSIRDSGVEVIILAPFDKTKEFLRREGFTIEHTNLKSHSKNPINDLLLLYDYFKLLRRISPSFILSFTIKPNIYASIAAVFLKIPVINNITGFGSTFLKKSFMKQVIEFIYKIIFKYSFAIFCQNTQDRDYVVSKLNIDSSIVKLLPGSGVNLNNFSYSPISENQSEGFRFLFVGRLLKAKGVMEFLNAAKKISESRKNVSFTLLGDCDQLNPDSISANVIEDAKKIKNILFLGHQQDIIKIVKNSDCVVLPSYSEGSPKSLIEASALGRPIIGSDIPGIRQIMPDEKNGYFCIPRDTQSLYDALIRMLDTSIKDRIRMSLEARKIAVEKFDESIVISKYNNEIKKILGSKL